MGCNRCSNSRQISASKIFYPSEGEAMEQPTGFLPTWCSFETGIFKNDGTLIPRTNLIFGDHEKIGLFYIIHPVLEALIRFEVDGVKIGEVITENAFLKDHSTASISFMIPRTGKHVIRAFFDGSEDWYFASCEYSVNINVVEMFQARGLFYVDSIVADPSGLWQTISTKAWTANRPLAYIGLTEDPTNKKYVLDVWAGPDTLEGITEKLAQLVILGIIALIGIIVVSAVAVYVMTLVYSIWVWSNLYICPYKHAGTPPTFQNCTALREHVLEVHGQATYDRIKDDADFCKLPPDPIGTWLLYGVIGIIGVAAIGASVYLLSRRRD